MSHRKELAEHLKLYGRTENEKLISLVQQVMWDELREEFITAMSVDNGRDRRRKDFNQAIFDPETGHSIFTRTTMDMVVDKFDQAVRILKAEK